MPIISLSGIRGGVGTTTLSVSLAWELYRLGKKVVIIDMSPDNLLRLHFNSHFNEESGWVNAIYENKNLQVSDWEYQKNLLFIPFGKLINKEETGIFEDKLTHSFWSSNLDKLKKTGYHWVIIDTSFNYNEKLSLTGFIPDISIKVVSPETNCHTRIYQQKQDKEHYILINNFDIRSSLQNDIYQYWLHTLPNIIPVTIHHDESILEAAASKCPIGQYRPQSQGATEAHTLAVWCLTLLDSREIN